MVRSGVDGLGGGNARRTRRFDDGFAWTVRNAVYDALVARGVPPAPDELAGSLGRRRAEIDAALQRLHDRHALFVERSAGGAIAVRMAHPFSGVPTPFVVRSGGTGYWANCAWDALGIPAALRADAEVAATAADDGSAVRLRIAGGALHAEGDAADVLVHVLLPLRRWYDDLVFT
jgi:hypothetical protein